MFDGLLFPLLALSALIIWAGDVIANLVPHHLSPVIVPVLVGLIALAVFRLTYWIVHLVWRVVKQPLESPPGSSPVSRDEAAPIKSARSQSLVAPATTTQRYGRLAFGLVLTGTLGTLLLMTISPRHELALIFGGVALLLAFLFGLMGWQERLGKFVVVSLGSVFALAGLALLIWMGALGPARQAAMERVAGELRAAKLAQLEQVKSELSKRAGMTIQTLSFGPVIERTLPMSELGYSYSLNLDTDVMLPMPANMTQADWSSGVTLPDGVIVVAAGEGKPVMVAGTSTQVEPVGNGAAAWENMRANDIRIPYNLEPRQTVTVSGETNTVPLTFAFRTQTGTSGLLQVTSFTDSPRGVKIRYKLVESGENKKQSPAIPGASFVEPPKLQFLAWQDEWKTNAPFAARHPDGSPVTNATELSWLKVVHAGEMNTTFESRPRFLKLWFSHPAFQRTDFIEVGFFDENGLAVKRGANGASSCSLMEASAQNGWLGWRCWTGSPDEGTNVLARLTVQLRYALGPLERTQEVTPVFNGTMSLEGGSLLSGIGQNAQRQAFVAIAVDPKTTRSRAFGVVARTKDGREIPHLGSGRSDSGLGVAVADFEFAVPLSSVAKFIIGTRPIRTNEWKNVVLPGN